MNMMKTTNPPAGLELLSDEETFLNELVDEQDVIVNTDIEMSENKSSSPAKMPVYRWQPKPNLWVQRTVNIKEIA